LHLNQPQLAELRQSAADRIYICFDADANGSGPAAARRLSVQLRHDGIESLRMQLPEGEDPASYFAAGAGPADFQSCLDRARP
jgi:DNA primase